MVIDLGGSTFDVSLFAIGEDKFELVATNGQTLLGGRDFDERLVQLCVEDFQRKR